MKISTKGRYALRLMVDIAQHVDDGPVSLRDAARRQQLSDKYLEQIVTPLTRAGLVRSVRGAGGGYLLTRRPEEYSVGDILRPLEGSLDPVDCSALNPEEGCQIADSCVTKYVWQRINESTNRTVDEIKLDQLVEESRKMHCKDIPAHAACKK